MFYKQKTTQWVRMWQNKFFRWTILERVGYYCLRPVGYVTQYFFAIPMKTFRNGAGLWLSWPVFPGTWRPNQWEDDAFGLHYLLPWKPYDRTGTQQQLRMVLVCPAFLPPWELSSFIQCLCHMWLYISMSIIVNHWQLCFGPCLKNTLHYTF